MRSAPPTEVAPPTAMSELEEPWGQLISQQANRDERIPIVSDKFVIGRAKGEISTPATLEVKLARGRCVILLGPCRLRPAIVQ